MPSKNLTLNQLVKKHNLPNACVQDLLKFLHEEKTRQKILEQSNQRPQKSITIQKDGYIGRYKLVAVLGKGGVGTVYLVLDEQLNREVAMKVMHKNLLQDEIACMRFREEGQIASQMQHPNIIPIYEMGELEDGRLYFTMERIKGHTLKDYIKSFHNKADTEGVTLSKLMSIFVAACRAIAHVHSHGVIHRDLKPSNIMIDDNGETLVVDWGLSKSLSKKEEILTVRDTFEDSLTEVGSVEGTPSFMAPEQATGDTENVGFEADVYALGAILYTILSGSQPFGDGLPIQVLRRVLTEPIPVLDLKEVNENNATYDVGEHLINIVTKAMSKEPSERYGNAGEMLRELRSWRFADERQKSAELWIRKSQRVAERRIQMQEQKLVLVGQCEALQRASKPWETTSRKRPLWQCEDEIAYLTSRIRNHFMREEQALLKALLEHGAYVKTRILLAQFYKERHNYAEEKGMYRIASEAEFLLQEHLDSIPQCHPIHEELTNYLNGTGKVSLETDQETYSVEVEKYLMQDRHLISAHIQWSEEVSSFSENLEMGSYLVTLHKTNFESIRYPIQLGRGEEWSLVSPAGVSTSLSFLPKGVLKQGECYVPEGWFLFGGDTQALNPLPKRKIWLNGFIIKQHPVTNGEYLEFLNDLIKKERTEDALRYAPKDRPMDNSSIIYGEHEDGTFFLQPDSEGDMWNMDWPVILIDWTSAMAYSQWYSEKTGRYWRLPFETEWEKAARGVDNRVFPWGDYFNPAWCSMRTSKKGRPFMSEIDEHPIDCSPYEVMGMAGNVREWTASGWSPEGPLVQNNQSCEDMPTLYEGLRVTIKGGSWYDPDIYCRSASRICAGISRLDELLGFRLLSPISSSDFAK